MSTIAQHVPADTIDSISDVGLIVAPDFRIEYCNPAWDLFALSNGGAGALATAVVGTNLLQSVAEPLRAFYAAGMLSAQKSRTRWDHEYECSSPQMYRRFLMHVYPERNGGWMIVHSRLVEVPHTPSEGEGLLLHYLKAGGLVVMCCHCRRARRADDPLRWDWVPGFLDDLRLRVSHGLCPVCRMYYYGV